MIDPHDIELHGLGLLYVRRTRDGQTEIVQMLYNSFDRRLHRGVMGDWEARALINALEKRIEVIRTLSK